MKNFGYKLLAILFTTLAITQTTIPMVSTSPIHINLDSITKALKGLNLNIHLGTLLKGVNFSSLKGLGSIPNLNLGNVLKGLNSLEKISVKVPDVKTNFINNIKGLTDLHINIKDINLGSLAELTKLNIPVVKLGNLMQGGFNLTEIADKVKGLSSNEANSLINNLKKGPKSLGADTKKAINLTKELKTILQAKDIKGMRKLMDNTATRITNKDVSLLTKNSAIPKPIRTKLQTTFEAAVKHINAMAAKIETEEAKRIIQELQTLLKTKDFKEMRKIMDNTASKITNKEVSRLTKNPAIPKLVRTKLQTVFDATMKYINAIAKEVEAAQVKTTKLTNTLTAIATTGNFQALLKLLDKNATELAESYQLMADKSIPAPIRKPLEQAYSTVFAQVKKLVNKEVVAMSAASNLTDLLALVVHNSADLALMYATIAKEAIPAQLKTPIEKAFNKVVARIKKLVKTEVLGASELGKLLVSSSITDNKILQIVSLVEKILASSNPKEIKEAVSTIKPKITKLIKGQIDEYDKLKDTRVSIGTDLDQDEKEFRAKRQNITKGAIEKLTGMTNLKAHELPTVAMCASGGGYRAMIGTRGFFVGAEDIGLMDATTYISCLSGGTWATWPYLLKKAKTKGFTAAQAQANLNDVTFPNSNPFLINNIIKNTQKVRDIAANFFTKYFMTEPITFVDVYGVLIGNALLSEMFGDNTYQQALHDMQAYSRTAESPLPIGTAIITNNKIKEWLEVSPFSAGSIYLNSSIPTETFGSGFDSCKVTELLPSQFAGYFLGTFGSAFALNSSDFLDESGLRSKLLDLPVVGDIIRSLDIPLTQKAVHNVSKKRPLAARLKNFSYNCTGNLKTDENLVMVDAGLAFNLPLPPLVDRTEREVDVICIIDMSGGIHDKSAPAGELLKAVQYFKKKGIPFPIKESDFKDKKINIGFEPCSVFKFSEEEMTKLKLTKNLTVLYFPWCDSISDCYDQGDKWCGTFNFNYTPTQVKDLAGCMSGNVKKSEDKIKQALIDCIKDKTEKGTKAA